MINIIDLRVPSILNRCGSAMPEADRLLGMYLHLARASQLRRQPMVRDKLLVLAGVQAQEMGLDAISALCRHRILSSNTRHLVRQWPTISDAVDDERFQTYLKQLKRRYSGEKVEHMLETLGIELGRERDAYFSDLEYAAALLDTRPEAIGDILAQNTGKLVANGDRLSVFRPAVVKAVPARGRNRTLRPTSRRDIGVVWGPFFLGLVVLVALAILSRV